jgi:hypothetical protein
MWVYMFKEPLAVSYDEKAKVARQSLPDFAPFGSDFGSDF